MGKDISQILTICVIVKDEEKNIRGFFEAFQFLTKNFLIVDTGSKDATKRICRELGCRIKDYVWNDNFSDARNFVISQVSTPWIFMVDADQRISKQDAEILKKHFREKKDANVMYVWSHFQDQKILLPRLWKTSLQLHYRYPVHELLELTNNVRPITANVLINQSDHQKNFVQSRAYYISLMEGYIEKHPQDHRMLYYLTSDSLFLKDYEAVIRWGVQFIKFSSELGLLSRVFGYLAEAGHALRLHKEAAMLKTVSTKIS